MKDLTTKAADNIRILAASMVEKAKSGHPGGAMGGADFVNILYSEFLRYNPDDSRYPFRDRFFLDPGHMSPMLYSVLALAGYFNMDELAAFRQWWSLRRYLRPLRAGVPVCHRRPYRLACGLSLEIVASGARRS